MDLIRTVLLIGASFLGLLSPVSAAVFPLKAAANGRFLVDQKDEPFLVVGDTAWSLIVQLGDDDVDRYLEDRQKRGFNSIIVNLIEHKFCTAPPKTRAGLTPFAIEARTRSSLRADLPLQQLERRRSAMRPTSLFLIRRACVAFTVLCLAGDVARSAEVVLEDNITYGKAGDTELKLDLARPQGNGPFPAIVFIHGGGWSGGSRQAYRGEIQEAAKRGYVAATVSYRLMKYDEAKKETTTATPIFPAQIHDAKAAIRWLRANAKKYHVDPDRIGVTGGSAGGHLSLLVGLTDPSSGLEGESGNPQQSSRVQAVVNVFGPTDMAFCYEKSSVAWIFRLFMGGTPAEAAERYKAASPITYVSKDDPPVLTLHGDQDALVPVEQAKSLDDKMKAAGASHTLMVFKGQGHGFGGASGKKAADATWEFFDRHLKP